MAEISERHSQNDLRHVHFSAPFKTDNLPYGRPAVTYSEPRKATIVEQTVSVNSGSDEFSSATSFASIPSTTSSQEDDLGHAASYPAVADERRYFHNEAYPATPPEFAKLFPSSRELLIRHDDATIDGNMNLRLDTLVDSSSGHKLRLTLFHLRMRNLRSREFSLRRYCRDSGREVCQSSRKVHEAPVAKRPGLQRSLSEAISHWRSKSDLKDNHSASLHRQDSGYESMYGDIGEDARSTLSQPTKMDAPELQDDINVEFSTYAHLSIRRRGLKADKKYDFDYWGERYSWKKVTRKEDSQISFELLRTSDGKYVAHIQPTTLPRGELEEELDMGGWITPMTLRITDQAIIDSSIDIAEVVVATGLIALCDDAIRRRFHRQEVTEVIVPLPLMSPLRIGMEFVSPKRLITEAFRRR